MTDPLNILTGLAILVLIGLLTSLVSKKAKIPNVLLLILSGIALAQLTYAGTTVLDFPPLFSTSISILALAIIVFDGASRLKLKQFDSLSFSAMKVTVFLLIGNLLLLSVATHFMFKPGAIYLSLLFAALMSGTDPATVMSMIKKGTSKVLYFLEIESVINTPLIVLLPFVIIDLMRALPGTLIINKVIEQLAPFLQQIITGIGSGILVGLILFKALRKTYEETLSPLALISAALLSYILAENLGGNGVLAVTTAGLFFGNIYVKEKMRLQHFSGLFASFLEILVFILVGLSIEIPWTFDFFLRSFILFIIFLLIRYLAIEFSFRDNMFTSRQKIFMALNASKGIAVAVVAFLLTTYQIQGMDVILDLILVFLIYSIMISTVVLKFQDYFLKEEMSHPIKDIEKRIKREVKKIKK